MSKQQIFHLLIMSIDWQERIMEYSIICSLSLAITYNETFLPDPGEGPPMEPWQCDVATNRCSILLFSLLIWFSLISLSFQTSWLQRAGRSVEDELRLVGFYFQCYTCRKSQPTNIIEKAMHCSFMICAHSLYFLDCKPKFHILC